MKKLISALLTIILVMSLCACAGSQGNSGEKTTLVVGTNSEFEPFEYLDDDTGEVVGFDMDMAQYIADYMGLELVIEDMNFNGLCNAVASGKVDIVIAGMSVDAERQLTVDFSDPYFTTTLSIVVAQESSISCTDDLVGKKVGVQLGTTSDIFLSDYVDCTVLQYNSATEAAMDLANGNIDAVVVDEQPAQKIAAALDLVILDEALGQEEYAIAMKKNSDELAADINAAIAALKADGTYDNLLSKWGLSAE